MLAVPSGLRWPYLTTASPAYCVAQRYAATVLYYATDCRNWETNLWCHEPGVHEYNFFGVLCEDLAVPAVTLGEKLQRGNVLARQGNGSIDATTEQAINTLNLPENSVGRMLPQELAALPHMLMMGL